MKKGREYLVKIAADKYINSCWHLKRSANINSIYLVVHAAKAIRKVVLSLLLAVKKLSM
jgi:hypothetical protein